MKVLFADFFMRVAHDSMLYAESDELVAPLHVLTLKREENQSTREKPLKHRRDQLRISLAYKLPLVGGNALIAEIHLVLGGELQKESQ